MDLGGCSADIGQRGLDAIDVGPKSTDFCHVSTMLGPNSTKGGQPWPGMDPRWVEFGHFGLDQLRPNVAGIDQSWPAIVDILADVDAASRLIAALRELPT